MGQAEDLLNDNLKQDMCDVLGSVCLGPIMANEVMFQYETSNFFDLCGVGGANNIIWNNKISDKENNDEENSQWEILLHFLMMFAPKALK